MRRTILLAGLLPLAACASTKQAIPVVPTTPAASVQARGETEAVGTANADAADDPAIWRNPANPAASLIVGTDKKAGLHVYDLTGKDRFFIDAGQVNNVDLKDMGEAGVIVAASDRNDRKNAKIALFRLDTAAAKLISLGTVAAGAGEAYGICLYRSAGKLHAFNVIKDGTVRQVELDLTGAAPAGRIVRTMKLATQSEGCVADERTNRLYVGEENAGVWRFDARADGPVAGTKIAAADGRNLVIDVEGVAIAAEGAGDGGYLLVSSQGDHAYAVYRLSDEAFMGRFRIAPGRFGSTEETDGIEVIAGDFGPDYPGGLFIAQDGYNPPKAQNFKFAAWADVKAALKLD